MASIANIYRDAPANPTNMHRSPTEVQLIRYQRGATSAYEQTGLRVTDLADECPGFTEDDGSFQVYKRLVHGLPRISFRAADPEGLQVVEGITVIQLDRIIEASFKASADGGESTEDFLFSRKAWADLTSLVLERAIQGTFQPVARNNQLLTQV